MFCQYCGAQLPDDADYCISCGLPTGIKQGQYMQSQGQQMMGQQGYNQIPGQQMMGQQGYNQIPGQQFGGYQAASPQGWQSNGQQFGPAQMNPAGGKTKPSGNGKKKKILIISLIAVFLIGGGLVAFFLLKNRGIKGAKAATKEALEATKKVDIDEMLNLVPDDILRKYIAVTPELANMGTGDISEFKNNCKQFLLSLEDYDDERERGKGMTVKTKGARKCSKNDIIELYGEEYTAEFLEVLSDVDEFAFVDCTISLEGRKQQYTDFCYKYNGSWYSVLGLAPYQSIAHHASRYFKADDLSSAETIYSALSSMLCYEDAYDELSSYRSETVIFTAEPGKPFRAENGINAPAALKELNALIGGNAPVLKYTVQGQNGWAVGFSSDLKPIVWISTANDPKAFELQPEICSEYR